MELSYHDFMELPSPEPAPEPELVPEEQPVRVDPLTRVAQYPPGGASAPPAENPDRLPTVIATEAGSDPHIEIRELRSELRRLDTKIEECCPKHRKRFDTTLKLHKVGNKEFHGQEDGTFFHLTPGLGPYYSTKGWNTYSSPEEACGNFRYIEEWTIQTGPSAGKRVPKYRCLGHPIRAGAAARKSKKHTRKKHKKKKSKRKPRKRKKITKKKRTKKRKTKSKK